jgi:hypothetical protein
VIGAYLRRGVAAGLVVGVLAGVFGLLVGEPSLDAAIAREATLTASTAGHGPAPAEHGPADHHGDSLVVVPRWLQKAGLVVGSGLVGLAVGALFGVAAAWAVGRVEGDDWLRSLKLGAAAVGAVVLLPALKYPPNPPGVGETGTIGTRSLLYLGLVAVGLLLAAGGWSLSQRLHGSGLRRPGRALMVATVLAAASAAVLALLPSASADAGVPAELLWSFRLAALGAQSLLLGGTAVAFGLLSARAGRRQPALR